ncbi:MAG: acyl carrier protein [Phyllobacteriaceae bacterium]|nr:acyl carrier protein [Phyllobacteriaceae bacterium]
MVMQIRELIANHKIIPVPVERIGDEDDLYDLGMTSFASVQLMLALEEAFDIEFPERMLNRKTFQSIAMIDRSVSELVAGRA